MIAPAPLPRRSAQEQARIEAAIRDLFEQRIPFNRVLGFRVVSLDAAGPIVRIDMRPEFVGHAAYGQLHGGVTSAVLDATAGLAITVAIAEKHADESAEQVQHRFMRLGTIDLRIDYLRRGIGRWFEAGAKVTRLGGRIGSAQMTLHADDGTLVATGAASFTIG